MKQHDREYYERLIDLTADPKWQEFAEECKKEIYQIQANALEVMNTTEQLHYAKGYVAAMATFVNLRDTAKKVLDNESEL